MEAYLNAKAAKTSVWKSILDYVLWIPLSYGAHKAGWANVGSLFSTWAVLGLLSVVLQSQAWFRAVRWWHVAVPAAISGLVLAPGLPRFLSRYIAIASTAMAALIPLQPSAVVRSIPEPLKSLFVGPLKHARR